MNPYIVTFEVLEKRVQMFKRQPTGQQLVRVAFAYTRDEAITEAYLQAERELYAPVPRTRKTLRCIGAGPPICTLDYERVAVAHREIG